MKVKMGMRDFLNNTEGRENAWEGMDNDVYLSSATSNSATFLAFSSFCGCGSFCGSSFGLERGTFCVHKRVIWDEIGAK